MVYRSGKARQKLPRTWRRSLRTAFEFPTKVLAGSLHAGQQLGDDAILEFLVQHVTVRSVSGGQAQGRGGQGASRYSGQSRYARPPKVIIAEGVDPRQGPTHGLSCQDKK